MMRSHGDSRPMTFDFSQSPRVYVQATHPDYRPAIDWFDQEKVQRMVSSREPIRFTLQTR